MKPTKPDFSLEHYHNPSRDKLIAGVAQAGMTALAGPLTMALVLFNPEKYDSLAPGLKGLNDSSNLSANDCLALYTTICQNASYVKVVQIHREYIDTTGINIAVYYGLNKLIGTAATRIDTILMDGINKYDLIGIDYIPVAAGTYQSCSIAAAQVIATVTRDSYMIKKNDAFPQFEFKKNKGYGTPSHLNAIKEFGITPLHRQSFTQISTLLGDMQ